MHCQNFLAVPPPPQLQGSPFPLPWLLSGGSIHAAHPRATACRYRCGGHQLVLEAVAALERAALRYQESLAQLGAADSTATLLLRVLPSLRQSPESQVG